MRVKRKYHRAAKHTPDCEYCYLPVQVGNRQQEMPTVHKLHTIIIADEKMKELARTPSMYPLFLPALVQQRDSRQISAGTKIQVPIKKRDHPCSKRPPRQGAPVQLGGAVFGCRLAGGGWECLSVCRLSRSLLFPFCRAYNFTSHHHHSPTSPSVYNPNPLVQFQ